MIPKVGGTCGSFVHVCNENMAGRCLSPLLSLLLVALAIGAAHGVARTGRRAKESVTMEDYLEGHKVDVEPPPKNASPLDLCIPPCTLASYWGLCIRCTVRYNGSADNFSQ